jgi:hypothetical protein
MSKSLGERPFSAVMGSGLQVVKKPFQALPLVTVSVLLAGNCFSCHVEKNALNGNSTTWVDIINFYSNSALLIKI